MSGVEFAWHFQKITKGFEHKVAISRLQYVDKIKQKMSKAEQSRAKGKTKHGLVTKREKEHNF